MELDRRQELIWASAALLFVAVVLVTRLWGFGIWDPWELNPADQARELLAGEDVIFSRPPLSTVLVSWGFAAFGVREWAGRLPFALCGLFTVVIAYLMVRRAAGARAGIYAAIVAGTTPLFVLNARQMLGDSPAFAAQALVGLAAVEAVLVPRAAGGSDSRAWRNTLLWLGAALLGAAVSTVASGAMLGPLPPLLAVVGVAATRNLFARPTENPQRATALYALTVAAAVLTVLVLLAVVADHAEYSAWLGGKPRGGEPPTFEVGIERIFHSFAPWSALLPLALGRMLLPAPAIHIDPTAAVVGAAKKGGKAAEGDGQAPSSAGAEERAPEEGEDARREQEGSLRLVLVLWAALGYGALTLFTSRYGVGTFVPVVALAGAVALLLRDVERSRAAWWMTGMVAALLTALIIRDFELYPSGPIEGLAIDAVTVPEVFNPKLIWAALLGLFAASVVLAFGSAPDAPRPDMKAPYRLIVEQWRRGWGFRAWLIGGALIAFLLLAFGGVSAVAADAIGLTTLVSKWGRRLAFLPFAVPVLVAAGQWILFLAGRLGRFRLVPILLCGAAVGAYSAQGFLPALSAHFSPREVYDSFNTLAAPDAVLGEYRVGGRAAAYYAHGEVRDIENQNDLIAFLSEPGRRWAAFPSDELPAINRVYRRQRGEHLFVADARSARVVLATNQPLEGVENQNFVAQYVRESAPERIQHPTRARFEEKIQLLGYDLDLPHGDHVGAGESFRITWYLRVLAPVPGSYKPFVHIDGQGNRLNGDHDPVDGRYPMRLWDEGDVVVDVQELNVPANYRPGPYTIFMGFYSGESRLEVVEGPEDDADRVRAGILQIH